MSAVKHKGIPFDFGTKVLVIPPIGLFDVIRLRGKVAAAQKAEETDPLAGADVCIDVVHAALKKNYPAMTRDEVAELLDVSNMGEAVQCVLDMNGERRKALEAAAAGSGAPGAQGVQHG